MLLSHLPRWTYPIILPAVAVWAVWAVIAWFMALWFLIGQVELAGAVWGHHIFLSQLKR